MAHSPGPWKVRKFGLYFSVDDASGQMLSPIHSAFTYKHDDAVLIAAAPELLAMLKTASAYVDDFAHEHPDLRDGELAKKLLREIEVLIKKAEGE